GLCEKTCTYLLMGNDSRKGLSHWQQVEFGSPRTVPGQRSDTIMLVVVDGRRDKAVVLSFPRDLWERIPHQGMGKITTASEGGPYRVAEVVQRLTGIRSGHFMTVTLAGFEEVIRAIGGIPICTDRPLYDKLAGLNLPKGCQTLDPYKALAYVRARHICGDTI